MGINRHPNYSWELLLHIVLKPGSSWRPCGNFQCLNNYCGGQVSLAQHTKLQLQPSGQVDLLQSGPSKCLLYQISFTLADIPKIAVMTLFGLWEYLCMTLVSRMLPRHFQRLINGILCDINFMFVYIATFQ